MDRVKIFCFNQLFSIDVYFCSLITLIDSQLSALYNPRFRIILSGDVSCTKLNIYFFHILTFIKEIEADSRITLFWSFAFHILPFKVHFYLIVINA